MDGLVFRGPGRVALESMPDPAVADPTDAVIRVTRSGLCGSDLHPYTGAEPAATGVVCGHEAAGEVVAAGAKVRRWAPGDRVLAPFTTSCGQCRACRAGLTSRCERGQLFGWGPPGDPGAGLDGAQATMLRVPLADSTLVAVPDGVDDDTAVLLADNVPTAWHAVQRAETPPGGRVAVIGLGAVGLCAVWAALVAGAGEVVAVDPVECRRAAAAALGATVTDPGAPLEPVDAVVDAAGPSAAQQLAAELVRPGGTISIIAVQTAEVFGIDPVTAYDKNLTIRCGRTPVRAVLDDLVPLLGDGRITPPTSAVVTHPGHPLSAGPGLYRAFADRADGLIKATFAPAAP